MIDNPMLLNSVIVCVYEWQLEDKEENELLDNIDQYIFTLDEWFERNKRKILTNNQ